MAACECQSQANHIAQRKVLLALLWLNAVMFFIELLTGWWAQSSALMADSLDMLADATVYGISLYAIGKSITHKNQAARLSGYLQAVLGLMMLFEIIRRIIWGSEPVAGIMLVVSVVALVVNIICLALITKHKDDEIHMRASWIFSKNDVIANIGVLLGGGLVWLLNSRWPDIIVGLVISLIILQGAAHILKAVSGVENEQTTGDHNKTGH